MYEPIKYLISIKITLKTKRSDLLYIENLNFIHLHINEYYLFKDSFFAGNNASSALK